MTTTKQLGQRFENYAERYFIRQGAQIVERNYRYRRAEVDLIVLSSDNCLLFIEVKFRSNLRFGNPEEYVTVSQFERICDVAEAYVVANNWNGAIRFDILAYSPYDRLHLKDVVLE